jgi:hypothetical protein
MNYASTIRPQAMMSIIAKRKKPLTPNEPWANLPMVVLAHKVKEAFLVEIPLPQ